MISAQPTGSTVLHPRLYDNAVPKDRLPAKNPEPVPERADAAAEHPDEEGHRRTAHEKFIHSIPSKHRLRRLRHQAGEQQQDASKCKRHASSAREAWDDAAQALLHVTGERAKPAPPTPRDRGTEAGKRRGYHAANRASTWSSRSNHTAPGSKIWPRPACQKMMRC